MRLALALVAVLAACHDKPAKPDPAAFAKMTRGQQCAATAPRAEKCADELMVADLHALGSQLGSGLDALEDKLRDSPPATDDEAHEMQRLHCVESAHFAEAVVACWDEDGCDAFAACVAKHRDNVPAR